MSEERVAAILDDIRRFGVRAARVVERGLERFNDPHADEQRRIARSLVVYLSSAADRLSRGLVVTVDFQGIRAVRNVMAHEDDDALTNGPHNLPSM